MEKPLSITLLYTYNIQGDLGLLPRLFTFIRQLRRAIPDESRFLLVDLGKSCAPEVWHCGITQGRSTLIVLDAMGYHAANTNGVLSPISRLKLVDQVTLGLVDDTHPHQDGEILFTSKQTTPDAALQIILTPKDTTTLQDNTLILATIDKAQVGQVTLRDGDITEAAIHTLPKNTAPEPTIAGAVDFVESEARYFEKRQNDG